MDEQATLLDGYQFDPFVYPLQELRDHETGRLCLDDAAQTCRANFLLEDEAQELAWGIHHVTIVHGPLRNDADRERLDQLLDGFRAQLEPAAWTRISGLSGYYTTISVAGTDAGQRAGDILEFAERCNTGRWLVLPAARPPAQL